MWRTRGAGNAVGGGTAQGCIWLCGDSCAARAGMSGRKNEPEAAGDMQGFCEFPEAPARSAETLRRASVGGLWNQR